MSVETSIVDYQAENLRCQGMIAHDTKVTGKRPLVLIVHDWSGRTPFVEEKAKRIASLGYVGFAVDMYGEGRLAKTKEDKIAMMQPLIQNRPLLLKRISAAYEIAKTLPDVDVSQVGAMGFCFGGLCALDLARSGADLKGVVSFHGALTKPDYPKKQAISASILALHGYADPMVPQEQVLAFAHEMTEAKADWQIHMYGNAMHAFTNPEVNDVKTGTVYNALADRRSWRSMTDFFEEIFS